MTIKCVQYKFEAVLVYFIVPRLDEIVLFIWDFIESGVFSEIT
jgi:hypothetical protein